jgi:N-acetylglucosamine-6-phosphate deacetylase
LPLTEAVTAATLTPADVLGLGRAGRLAPGAAADLVVLSTELAVVATVVGGQAVHDPQHLLEPLGWT